LQFNFFDADDDKYKTLAGFEYQDEFIDPKQEHLAKEEVRKGGLPPLVTNSSDNALCDQRGPSLLVLLAVRTPS